MESLAEGFSALASGNFQRAESIASETLGRSPIDADARLLLALALAALRRPADALPHFEMLVQQCPGEASHWSNWGNCLLELERWDEALAALGRGTRLGGDPVHAGVAEARALFGLARFAEAEARLDRVLPSALDDVDAAFLKVRLLLVRDDVESAGTWMSEWMNRPMGPVQANDAGDLLLQVGWYSDALRCFEAALSDPDVAVAATLGKASALERLNLVDEAESCLEALAADAGIRSVAERQMECDIAAQIAARRGRHQEACELWRKAIAAGVEDTAQRSDLELKLARSLQAIGDAEGCMVAACEAHRRKLARAVQVHSGMPPGDRLLSLLDVPVPPRFPRFRDAGLGTPPDPVFVVGFPRSGTTLLEQFLDAHPALRSFDEQPFLHRRIDEMASHGVPFPEGLDRLNPTLIEALRCSYFRDVGRLIPEGGVVRAVDKNPLNIVRLPLVAAMFPRAKVILALRHPCDVVLSCFLQNFRSPAFSVTFQSLESTAAMYSRVMAHFERNRHVLGLDLHVNRYEDFVSGFEAEARSIVDFLDLDWADEMLAFTSRAAKKGHISTPSYSQVVQPVSRTAVGRWEAFRPWFEQGALKHLEPWIHRWGY